MKNNSEIFARWDIGAFFGDGKSHARVTVEPNWKLNLINVGTDINFPVPGPTIDRVGPFRMFQNLNGPLTSVVEVPNIKSIATDRSIDTDAGSCTIIMNNQWMDNNTVPAELANQLGKPGYFTWNRGDSPEARARWNHTANAWNNVLVPNALLRTYEGYGGYVDGVPMSLVNAINGNFITITGTWIVDTVTVGTDGLVTIKCRDAAKLLLVQQLFPPLVPSTVGTLKYSRWIDTPANTVWNPGAGLITNNQIPTIPLVYLPAAYGIGSHTDYLLGSWNASVMGYFPASVFDGLEQSIAIGASYGEVTGADHIDYWVAACSGDINRVYVSPWGGGYTVYISVQEGGIWQGSSNVPYIGPNPDGALPYVMTAGVSNETPTWFELPRTYSAQAIRITLTGLKLTSLGDNSYRTGLREVRAGLSALPVTPWTFAMAKHPSNGYWVIDATGQQFFFGEARQLTKNDAVGISTVIHGAVGHPTTPGFWTMEQNGRVHAYGASQFYGDASGVGANDFVDIAVTHTGNGYWLLRQTGGVYTYGDAGYLDGIYMGAHYLGEIPSQTPIENTATAITGHPSIMGYWITDHLGQVGSYFGETVSPSVHFFGQVTAPFPQNAAPTAIEPMQNGLGYWILWSNGQIHNFGSAANDGQPLGGSYTIAGWPGVWWDLIRTTSPISPSTQGYWALRADGKVGAFNATYFGAPGESGATIRSNGNYRDYVDIIFDLLAWSGFAYYQPLGLDSFRFGVVGNLEQTGAWSEEPIAEDIFDKKPVMDAITTIKEIVGYLFWVDETGGVHFESPNWYGPGNWLENGTRSPFIPDIDETFHLTQYSTQFDDQSLRSEIIISNSLPEVGNATTVTSRYVPPGQNTLRGMIRPAMWVNEVFSNPAEQAIMAELIGMHIWFSQRQGSVTCSANPCIQINDQVRIWERVSAESYIHYVRGVSTTHDLETGVYEMTLTTHWMGSNSTWVILPPGGQNTNQNNSISISAALLQALKNAQNSTSQIVSSWGA